MADLEQQFLSKVPELREVFFSKYASNVTNGDYDERDIERVRNDDSYMQCFMRAYGTDLAVEKPAERVDSVLKFRKEIGVNDMSLESFPKELLDRQHLYWHGKNLQNQKVLLFKIAKHKKGTFVEEAKKHIFYMLEQHHKATPGERIVLVFDFTGAGVTNMDLDIVKFIISSLTNYFPCLLAYILLFEMPMLLSAVWRIISSWLSEEQKRMITLVKKSDMSKYIACDQLEDHMIKK